MRTWPTPGRFASEGARGYLADVHPVRRRAHDRRTGGRILGQHASWCACRYVTERNGATRVAVPDLVQTHEPKWVTVPEAAGILGVTPETIRRRLRRGDLHGQHVHDPGNPLGRVWRVALPEARNTPVDVGSPARADVLADAQALEIARLHGALADRAREIERLHGIVERLAVPALPPPPADQSVDAQALEIARLHGALADRAREIERLHGIVERLATPALAAPAPRPWWRLW